MKIMKIDIVFIVQYLSQPVSRKLLITSDASNNKLCFTEKTPENF
jgi:hypothetical protein